MWRSAIPQPCQSQVKMGHNLSCSKWQSREHYRGQPGEPSWESEHFWRSHWQCPKCVTSASSPMDTISSCVPIPSKIPCRHTMSVQMLQSPQATRCCFLNCADGGCKIWKLQFSLVLWSTWRDSPHAILGNWSNLVIFFLGRERITCFTVEMESTALITHANHIPPCW